MGSGASTAAAGIEIISPRVEMTKKGPKNDVVLDSAPLSDVESGTIHYRHQTPGPSVNDPPGKDRSEIPTGYFFHPKLNDYSELGDPEKEEAYKFVRVAQGPNRFKNQNLYYVSGLGFQGNNSKVPEALLSTLNGKYSKRIYGHKYFVMTCDDAEDMETSADMVDGCTALSDSEIKMTVSSSSTVKDVRRKLGHHFICPLAIIHVLSSCDDELEDELLIGDVFEKPLHPDYLLLLYLKMQ